jgi:hypothetical protein
MSYHKRQILLDLLNEGKVMIILDSNKEGTVLPTKLMNLLQVKLNLSYRFENDVFEISDDQIKVDLSFNGKKFLCTIPMDSIYYMSAFGDLEGVPFLEDMPEIFIEMAKELEELDALDDTKDNEIDFLSNIPLGEAVKVKNSLLASAKKSKKSKK